MIDTSFDEATHDIQISSIEVDDLFGDISYNINIPDQNDLRGGRLILLYGDNGSGKTTILSLLHNVLSRADKRGHRTFIAKTPFRRFSVTLTNGSTIEVRRDVAEPGT